MPRAASRPSPQYAAPSPPYPGSVCGKKPTARVSTTSRGLIRSLLATSDRLTLLTRHEAELEERLGVLRIVTTKVRLPRRAYGVATRLNWHPTALQQTFLEMLIRHGRQAATAYAPNAITAA